MKTVPDDRRCTHTTHNTHARCRSPRVSDSDYCAIHERRVPGMFTVVEIFKNKHRLDTAEGIHGALSDTLRGLASGEIPPAKAKSISYICQTMLASLARVKEERSSIKIKNEAEARNDEVIYNIMLEHQLKTMPRESQKEEQDEGHAPRPAAAPATSSPTA